MRLTPDIIKHINTRYPENTPEQIARDLGLKPRLVYTALGLQAKLWARRIETLAGYVCCLLLLSAPFLFLSDISDFADLPQRVYIQTVAVFLLICWAVHILITAEIRLRQGWLCFCVAVLMGWSFVTLIWMPSLYEGLYAVVHWAACGSVFFVMSSVLDRSRWGRVLVTGICTGAVGVVLLGLGQEFFDLNWVPTRSRPAAVFANPNIASQYLAIVLPLIACLSVYRRRNVLGPAFCVLLMLGFLFAWYSGTRAIWAALAGSLVWTVLLLGHCRFGSKFKSKTVLTGLCIIVAVIVVITVTVLSGWVYKYVHGSARYRVVVWHNSFEMIKEHPLRGVGAGGFKLLYPAYATKNFLDLAIGKDNKQMSRAHNDYIQTAAELGVTGLVLFLILLFYGLFIAWRLVTRTESTGVTLLAAGLSAGIIAFMVEAFFSFPLQRSIPPLMVFAYLGILVLLHSSMVSPEQVLTLKVPRPAGIGLLVIVSVLGALLIRFNAGTIVSDRYFLQAMRMESIGSHKKALSAALTAHSYNTYRMDVLSTAGRAYVAIGKSAEAIDVLTTVTKKQPYNINALFFLGAAYANADRTDEALETFRRLLQLRHQFRKAQQIVSTLKAGQKVKIKP